MIHPRTLMLALGIAVLGASVWAHDGHDHIIMGTVMARDAVRIEVKTPSGEVLSIAVTDKTTTTRNKKKIALKDVEVGRRVVVNIGNGEDPLVARDIQVGVAAAAPTTAGGH